MKNIERKFHKLDATGVSAGRLASTVAILLIGKNKVDYTPQYDLGDFVQISNIGKLKFTGNKLETKIYYRNTGYIGNLKSTKLSEYMATRPDFIFKKIVRNMLPDNRLRVARLKRLTFKK
ncbi:MAG: 50S ribosomal protein L13 [Parcubacteria group bacterium CG1_02_37_51]|uniref:Large ribosomal subunit protein uL13 n=3 Tax=Candidatus Komeiliibacteriota TaxID=1817908 RepID=A0A2M7RCQ5_9BACT|nr:MAG: 50S ribosomal protein L13 [Parcubacteria group bacterium CG1_02_37_51]PIY94529.1 MAG: 50S ribosomal protein L13 [Candidatus Komeilibacteria bacterium CG_4_10_14_0_8_um_filter_37_78]